MHRRLSRPCTQRLVEEYRTQRDARLTADGDLVTSKLDGGELGQQTEDILEAAEAAIEQAPTNSIHPPD